MADLRSLRSVEWVCRNYYAMSGTRFPVSTVLAEIADGRSVDTIAEDYEISVIKINNLLRELADMFENSDDQD